MNAIIASTVSGLLTPPMITIYGYVLGDESGDIFSVHLPFTDTIAQLKTAIINALQPDYNHVGLRGLAIWRVSVPFGPNVKGDVAKLGLLEKPGDTLKSFLKISSIFPFETTSNNHVHVVVKRPREPNISLNCYVLGDDSARIFMIKLPSTGTIAELKKLIKAEKSPKFEHVCSDDITIWSTDVPITSIEKDLADLRLVNKNPLQPLSAVVSSILSSLPAEQPELVHIVVEPPLELYCYVLGDNPSQIFCVKLPNTSNIANLRKVIKAEKSPKFQDVVSDELIIWSAIVPVGPNFTEEIAKSLVDKDSLPPLALLSNLPPSVPGHVHIVVKAPPGPLKHRLSELSEDTHLNRLKRTKLATNAPSAVARTSVYTVIQNASQERVFDDRPKPDHAIPPISLLYGGFGDFLDFLDGDNVIPDWNDKKRSTLEQTVDEFAEKMSEYYTNEDQRRDTALPILNRIFSIVSKMIPMLHASSIGSVRTDGHIIGGHDAAVEVTEFKNQITGINAIPEVEALSYIVHSQVHGKNIQDLLDRWRIPSLCLTIVGSEIKFYAAITFGHRILLVSLTPGLSCIQCASDGRDRKALYAAFIAASVLLARIFGDVQKYLITALPGKRGHRLGSGVPPPLIPNDALFFPAISRLRRYNSSSDDYLFFQIRQRYMYTAPNSRLLYIAEVDSEDKQIIVVKFVRSYSLELHALCTQRGHAPNILAFEKLPGGWFAIAMSFIKDGVIITDSERLHMYKERWIVELRELVNLFHSHDLVHGDLRNANILCNDDGKMFLLDFDWGGKVGEARYPTLELHQDLLVADRISDIISKEDDIRVLKKTLDKLAAY